MTTLRIDIETFSSVDLKKCGAHKYAESPDFEILLLGYAYDAEPVELIDLACGEQLPPRLRADLLDPLVIKTAYNAQFEIVCINSYLCLALDPAQWRCTSVHALYLGLPGNLAEVGRVIGLSEDQQKRAGLALIKYFCMPCKAASSNGHRNRNYAKHDPEKWAQFRNYCIQDVETERLVSTKLARFPVPETEQALWALDQKINKRGIMLDLELVHCALAIDAASKEQQLAEATALTGLSNPNSRNQLLEWLQIYEGDVTELTKQSIQKLLLSTDTPAVQRILELRSELSMTSVAKYQAMARAVCRDGRIRDLTQFYGANRTGRWAGRIVQVQNLPRNVLKDLDVARELVKTGRLDHVQMLFGNVADTLSQLIRTAFVGPFIVVDFSAIEARVIAWMSNCRWRMRVFATHGRIYEASAEQMFKLAPGSVDKKSPYRQRGKVAELALGYQGGAGALKTLGALEMGLTEEELEPIKEAWRKANPEIVQLWYAVERSAKLAVIEKRPNELTLAGGAARLHFHCESGFLFITLPSRRRLAYVKPRIELQDLVRNKFTVARAESLTYEGLDQKTKQWSRIGTYGGKLVENITQAIARDCLRESMFAIDAAGFNQVTTVHDEILIEADTGLDQITAVMARPVEWAPELTLHADGFTTAYYMKETD